MLEEEAARGSPGEDAGGEEARILPAAVGQLCADTQREGHRSLWGRLVVPQHCLQDEGQDQNRQARHDLMQDKRGRVLLPARLSLLLTCVRTQLLPWACTRNCPGISTSAARCTSSRFWRLTWNAFPKALWDLTLTTAWPHVLNVLAAYFAKACRATTVSWRGRDSHSSETISRAASLGHRRIHGELLLAWVEAKPP